MKLEIKATGPAGCRKGTLLKMIEKSLKEIPNLEIKQTDTKHAYENGSESLSVTAEYYAEWKVSP